MPTGPHSPRDTNSTEPANSPRFTVVPVSRGYPPQRLFPPGDEATINPDDRDWSAEQDNATESSPAPNHGYSRDPLDPGP